MPDDRAKRGDEAEGEEKESTNTSAGLPHVELVKKLTDAEDKVNKHWERILRMQADNDNLLRRTERDVANAHKYALEKFVNELLPVVDSLELCITSVQPDGGQVTAVIEGVQLTLKMFHNALEKFGVKQVNPVGKEFDPEFEQAISVLHDPKAKPGTVLSVLQKGYTLNNRLLRPALVVVAKAEQE